MNRLQYETSPYLLQHASNPVDWYPWGNEAFDAAMRERKPVFLSIGYSTCHWCHVMARESFENGEVAEILNAKYISIKVDREERPDVDSVYMEVCTTLNGSGGWPLTLILGPNQKPFWAGTYLNRDQLIYLLNKASEFWENDYGTFLAQGNKIVRHLAAGKNDLKAAPDIGVIKEGVKELSAMYDEEFGGFGRAPKFPTPHIILFLLKYGEAKSDSRAIEMALGTLEHMFCGGIYDHAGGGFSRYSTDGKWLVPHFEKTLYDNALLALCYSRAYEITGNEQWKSIAVEIFGYMLSELADPDGGFYCGQDADAEGSEGAYYIFTKEEIKDILGDGAEEFCECFGVTANGNFEGSNILNLIGCDDRQGAHLRFAPQLEMLRRARKERMKLGKDTKILPSWNGLAAASLSHCGAMLGRQDLIKAAERCIDSIFEKSCTGRLADLVFTAWGLLEYYSAAKDPDALDKACSLADELLWHFFDHENGGLYPYSSEGEQLILRKKDSYDDAMPSCNSVGALVLGKLAVLTERADIRDAARLQYEYIAGCAKRSPSAHCFSLYALMDVCGPDVRSRSHDICGPEPEIDHGEEEIIGSSGLFPEISGKQYMCHDGYCDLPDDDSGN